MYGKEGTHKSFDESPEGKNPPEITKLDNRTTLTIIFDK
jgi:hypothetical protein